jgi:hypothetical protein
MHIAGHTTWSLVFRNGLGCCSASLAEEEPKLLEDLFTMQVWDHDEHGVIIRTDNQVVTFVDALSRFDPLKMTLTFGHNKKRSDFSCCQLKLPRAPAASVLISLKSVYVNLGLTQFAGKSWKWIQTGMKAWTKWMEECGLSAHLLPSHKHKAKVSVSELTSNNK